MHSLLKVNGGVPAAWFQEVYRFKLHNARLRRCVEIFWSFSSIGRRTSVNWEIQRFLYSRIVQHMGKSRGIVWQQTGFGSDIGHIQIPTDQPVFFQTFSPAL